MVEKNVVSIGRWLRAGRVLAASAVLAVAACGGGDGAGDSGEVQSIASTAPGGQSMPTAGTIQPTSRPLDVAIDGGGAFVLVDPSNGTQVLSRVGHFDIDAQGRLINGEGWLVEGVASGTAAPTFSDLSPLAPIPLRLPPAATRRLTLEANLDSRSRLVVDSATHLPALDIRDASTFNNAVSMQVYDVKGQAAVLVFYFRRASLTAWDVHAYAEGIPVRPDVDGVPQPFVRLDFPPDGASPINPSDARQPLGSVIVDIPVTALFNSIPNAAIPGVEVNLSSISSFGAPFGVTQALQDGSPAATLSSATLRATGELVLTYSSGRVDDSRRVMLARTSLADRLHRYGGSGWLCGYGCQPPVIAQPGQMLTGTLLPGSLSAAN